MERFGAFTPNLSFQYTTTGSLNEYLYRNVAGEIK